MAGFTIVFELGVMLGGFYEHREDKLSVGKWAEDELAYASPI